MDCHILHVIWRIYEKQRAFVFVDQGTVSQFFNIVCGVRQGDPLSPLLFNNVTRVLFCELKEKWQRKGWGSIVGSDLGQRMTHAMFADDTILVASTRQSLQRMIEDTRVKLAEHGLKLNIDKCMIQTNASTSLKALRVNGELMPLVLPCQGFPVLGTNFTLHGRTSREIQLRISAAWGKFHQLWHLLKRRDTNAQKRLRLFDIVSHKRLCGVMNPGCSQLPKGAGYNQSRMRCCGELLALAGALTKNTLIGLYMLLRPQEESQKTQASGFGPKHILLQNSAGRGML
jgi:hypothetical protein